MAMPVRIIGMKYFAVLATSVFTVAMVGCSSAKKQTAATPAPAPVTAPAAQTKTASDSQKLSCTKGSDTRVLEVVSKDKGCVLNYTKAGKETAAASSSHSVEHCEKSKDKISKKLVAAGYQCQ